jgi:hypothetical protein
MTGPRFYPRLALTKDVAARAPTFGSQGRAATGPASRLLRLAGAGGGHATQGNRAVRRGPD